VINALLEGLEHPADSTAWHSALGLVAFDTRTGQGFV